MRRFSAMRIAAALALAVSLMGQRPSFDVQSRLVIVPATVTDAKGRSVDGLEASNFIVLDNGRPQRAVVDTIATGVAPIALIVAIQSSGISSAVLEKVQKIGAMIEPLITGERGCAGVISFAQSVKWLEDCTHDPDALTRAFERVRPGDDKKGCMLDAVHAAIERLRKVPNSRRVLLLISESRDRGSETDLNTALTDAQAAGVLIYAATYSAFKTAFTTKSSATAPPSPPKRPRLPSEDTGTPTGAPPTLTNPSVPAPAQNVDILGGIIELKRMGDANTTKVLTGTTGGTTFPFTRQKGLEDAIQKLGAELHSQYVVSFVPDSAAPGYHQLEIRIAGHGDVRIRARPGYWSVQ